MQGFVKCHFSGSEKFDNFLELMGERVKLKGWSKFKGKEFIKWSQQKEAKELNLYTVFNQSIEKLHIEINSITILFHPCGLNSSDTVRSFQFCGKKLT